MEKKTVKLNLFNASLKPVINDKKKMTKNQSPYRNQIKELLNRRKTDEQKNDYPFHFQKNEERKHSSMKTIPNPSTAKANIKITTPTSFKIQSNNRKRFSYKSMSIETRNLVFCSENNSNGKDKGNERNSELNIVKKSSEDYLSTAYMNKTNSATTQGVLNTNESNGNNNNLNHNKTESNEKRKWKFIEKEVHLDLELDKFKSNCSSKKHHRKRIAFEKYLTTCGSPVRSSHVEFFKDHPVKMDRIKSLFVQYKQKKHVAKSKSGEWLCNISPSLLYNSNPHKFSLSKEKDSIKNSYVYPSNKLYL